MLCDTSGGLEAALSGQTINISVAKSMITHTKWIRW